MDIEINSGVNERAKGFVTLRCGSEAGQMDPDEARRIGLWLIEAAQAAETDALFVHWTRMMGMADQQTAAALQSFRDGRDFLGRDKKRPATGGSGR